MRRKRGFRIFDSKDKGFHLVFLYSEKKGVSIDILDNIFMIRLKEGGNIHDQCLLKRLDGTDFYLVFWEGKASPEWEMDPPSLRYVSPVFLKAVLSRTTQKDEFR